MEGSEREVTEQSASQPEPDIPGLVSWAMDQTAPQLPESAVFSTVLYYVLLILVVPVASFFISKSVLFELVLRLETPTATLCSTIVAVVAVHVTLGVYVARAFREPKDGKRD